MTSDVNNAESRRINLLWSIAITSLVLNVVVIAGVLFYLNRVGLAFDRISTVIAENPIEDFTIPVAVDESLPISMTVNFSDSFQVPVSITVPVSTSVLFEEMIQVPINESVRINRNVRVSVRIPIINQDVPIDIPIEADIPISLNVAIPVSYEIPVQIEIPIDFMVDVPIETEIPIEEMVPVKFDIPVEVPLQETGIGRLLTRLAEEMASVSTLFGRGDRAGE